METVHRHNKFAPVSPGKKIYDTGRSMISILSHRKEINEQSAKIISSVKKNFPLSSVVSQSSKAAPMNAKAMKKIADEVRAFTNAEHLGWLGKAMLANNVKWQMRDLGYPDAFVDNFIISLWVQDKT